MELSFLNHIPRYSGYRHMLEQFLLAADDPGEWHMKDVSVVKSVAQMLDDMVQHSQIDSEVKEVIICSIKEAMGKIVDRLEN